MLDKITILTLILTITIPLYAEEEADSLSISGPYKEIEPSQKERISEDIRTLDYREKKEFVSFSNWINLDPYAIRMDKKRERKKIREDWKRFFGLDFFYPYFKAKEATRKIEKRGKVKILNLKGKPEIKEDEAKYIFRLKF